MTVRMPLRLAAGLVVGALAVGCAAGDGSPSGPATPGGSVPPGTSNSPTGGAAGAPAGGAAGGAAFAISLRPELQWKRAHAFESDLALALGLPPEQLCNELGSEPCIRGVHISPLGGHDPFASGLLESSAEPLATTPTAYERIVLSACARRAKLEQEGTAPAELFAGVDLAGRAPDPASDAARAVVTRLVRRFLARDPAEDELTSLATLAVDASGAPVSGLAFAQASCLAVGTSSEFIFF